MMQRVGVRSEGASRRPRAGLLRAGRIAAGALGLTLLAACVETRGGDQSAVSAGDLAPIQRDYRTRIVEWAKGYYAEPRSLRATQISDPVLIRDRTGRLLWLVCIAADARVQGGGYMGPQIQAFGFAPPSFVSSPLDRNRTTLVREDCGEHPLTWRAWPGLQQLQDDVATRAARR